MKQNATQLQSYDNKSTCIEVYMGVNDTYVWVVVVVAIDTTFGCLSGSSNNHSKSNLAERTNMSEIRGGTEPRRRTDVPVDNIQSSLTRPVADMAI